MRPILCNRREWRSSYLIAKGDDLSLAMESRDEWTPDREERIGRKSLASGMRRNQGDSSERLMLEEEWLGRLGWGVGRGRRGVGKSPRTNQDP